MWSITFDETEKDICDAPRENQTYGHHVCMGNETGRDQIHVARRSILIFERKQLCFFVKYSVQLFSRPALLNLDLKEFFESSSASRVIYCPRFFILCLE